MTTPTNSDNVIDSRDVIVRIDELTDDRADLEAEADEAAETAAINDTNTDLADAAHDAKQALADWDEENGDELAKLKAFAEEGEQLSDWEHGETLIRDDYFQTYAQQLADDLGCINGEVRWPLNCIDWEQAARELKVDYTSVDFDGVTYWGRS